MSLVSVRSSQSRDSGVVAENYLTNQDAGTSHIDEEMRPGLSESDVMLDTFTTRLSSQEITRLSPPEITRLGERPNRYKKIIIYVALAV